jgi:hypothetical protein
MSREAAVNDRSDPPVLTLADYPYIVVRVRCEPCRRANAYRLARLAQAFGAGATMDEVMDRLFLDCPYRLTDGRQQPRKYEPRCLAFLQDLHPRPRPPDLPAGLLKLRVVDGGKG